MKPNRNLVVDNVSCMDGLALLIHSVIATDAGMVLNWSSREGYVYDINWSTNLTEGFNPWIDGLPATPNRNSYTDAVHNASMQGMYQVQERTSTD